MTVSEAFSEWYERVKSAVTETVGPGQQKGAELDSCVRQVMNQGHDRESAYAICNESLKAGYGKGERDDLLDTSRAVSEYDPQVPLTFKQLVEYTDVDVKGEADLDLPNSCRRCQTETRAKGSFMCPECDPMVDEKASDVELVGSGVQEAGGEEEETSKAGPERVAVRKQYLTPDNVDDAPADAEVKADGHGLYYEVSDDAVDQKFDPMANGHDLNPETGRGTCEATGEAIAAEQMQDLFGDCPHCGEPLSVLDQKADEYGVDVFRLIAAEDDDTEYNGNVLGLGVEFPEAGVYVDWRLDAHPDPLDNPHVSEYGSIADLRDATGHEVESVERYQTGVDVKQKLAQKALPDNAVRIADRSEAPEGATVQTGDQGGLYYVPGGGGGADGGEEEGGGNSEAESAIADAMEVDESDVSLAGLEPDIAESAAMQLGNVAEQGWTENIEEVRTTVTENDPEEKKEAVAAFSPTNNDLFLNPDVLTEETLAAAADGDHLEDPTPEGVVSHEVGHARHAEIGINDMNLRGSFETLPELAGQVDAVSEEWGRPAEELEEIASTVSTTAALSGKEFVAEVHAGKVAGEEYSDEVNGLYQAMGGPEVNA